jgi:hypothetical protein
MDKFSPPHAPEFVPERYQAVVPHVDQRRRYVSHRIIEPALRTALATSDITVSAPFLSGA